MACIRKRRGKWIVDYRDGAGARRWVTCPTKKRADAVLAEKIRESGQANRPAVNPNITVKDYSERWLTLIKASVKPATMASYKGSLKRHILPVFGSVTIRRLVRGRIRSFLAYKLESGLSRSSVRVLLATLRKMLNDAVDDGILLANPAERLGRHLKLSTSAQAREEKIKALDRDQLAAVLKAARQHEPRYYPLLFLLARTGLRIGEALGLQWQDLDFENREILVERSLSANQLGSTKSGRSRRVDMSQSLREVLRRLQVERKEQKLKQGWAEMPEWVFCRSTGQPMDHSRVTKAFKRSLKRAKVPLHFTLHGLRHTFASQLLQMGESIQYVQQQLGHASITLTVDTYGRWLPMGNKAAVDRLDEQPSETLAKASGSKVVADEGIDEEGPNATC